MKMAKESKLNNVVFKPLVSIEEYPKLLKSANVGLITLSRLNKECKTHLFEVGIEPYLRFQLDC